MDKRFYVYILTNKNNQVLYTGVTSDMQRRVWEHKEKLVEGFTKRYNTDKLVYYEVFDRAEGAIQREKKIKGGSRLDKIKLIERINREWNDLYSDL
jgi:putative endonuclease